MSSPRTTCVVWLILLIVAVGCGGAGYNGNNVTVSVSPPTAAVSENGQVPLQATVNGLCPTCAPSIYLWYIAENNSGGLCTNTPPIPQCPAGVIQESGFPTLTATYTAPSTAGTYHVIAEWSVGSVNKTGTSVVTVSP
jgi:hypothetical protein